MSFKSSIKNPLGFQKIVATQAYPNVASETVENVLVITLPKGMWVVNVNNILATADNYAGGSRINNYKQRILYGATTRELSSLVGTSAVQIQLASIAFIACDGATPITVSVEVKTNDAGTYSIDDGDVTFTKIY